MFGYYSRLVSSSRTPHAYLFVRLVHFYAMVDWVIFCPFSFGEMVFANLVMTDSLVDMVRLEYHHMAYSVVASRDVEATNAVLWRNMAVKVDSDYLDGVTWWSDEEDATAGARETPKEMKWMITWRRKQTVSLQSDKVK